MYSVQKDPAEFMEEVQYQVRETIPMVYGKVLMFSSKMMRYGEE